MRRLVVTNDSKVAMFCGRRRSLNARCTAKTRMTINTGESFFDSRVNPSTDRSDAALRSVGARASRVTMALGRSFETTRNKRASERLLSVRTMRL
jgi:hypothetical protein